MRYAVIKIEPDLESDLMETGSAFTAALNKGIYQGERFTFETPGALFSAITPRRWDVLNYLQGKPAMSIRELAKCLKRDVKNVHSDVTRLLAIGLIEKNEAGQVLSPFSEIRTEFVLKGAA
ncbi:MAG: transcriptional regulator [Thiothrix sp.]|nr:transcriptional regulator [Thiothrix sp.]